MNIEIEVLTLDDGSTYAIVSSKGIVLFNTAPQPRVDYTIARVGETLTVLASEVVHGASRGLLVAYGKHVPLKPALMSVNKRDAEEVLNYLRSNRKEVWKELDAALQEAIDAHGPITPVFKSSVVKRTWGHLKALVVRTFTKAKKARNDARVPGNH